MVNRRTPISVGTLKIDSQARELVLEALDNNRLSYGPMMKNFEKNLSRLHGCKYGVMSNSGTSALQLALQTLKETYGWDDDDEVIIPAITFVATANIVYHNRMTPVPVDVESDYYEMDPKKIEDKITQRTRAIIPVHLFGQPADMDPIQKIARRHKLKIIEDSCETMFATYKGKSVGSFGEIGCFSTYIAHILVTGVGGMCTTNNFSHAKKLHSLVNHGRDPVYLSIEDDDIQPGKQLEHIIQNRFKFISIGHSYRATELEAAIGLAQLKHSKSFIKARRTIAKSMLSILKPFESHVQLPRVRPGSEHSFMMFPLVLKNQSKIKFVNFLESNGVETRDMLPLTNQPIHQKIFGWNEDDYPIAKWINKNGFYIGCHQNMSKNDLLRLQKLFGKFFKE